MWPPQARTTRHVVHHCPSIDWCPWIDALGSVWDDIKKDTSKCPPDGWYEE